MNRYLILEDGTTFKGKAFGADVENIGQVVFTTGMSGYQETITDQSCNGQILNFTAPILGNYGINKKFNQSDKPTVKGVLAREISEVTGNYQSKTTLNDFLKDSGIPGIFNIDTRAITLKIRKSGSLRGAIVNSIDSGLVKEITNWSFGREERNKSFKRKVQTFEALGEHVVLLDFGYNHGLVRNLNKRGIKVTVVPGNYSFKDIEALRPDGILLSNGPGSPELYTEVVETIAELQEAYPLLGVSLGHQLLAMANGAKIYKMRTGHHGFNHPVKDLAKDKIIFTCQNHSYAVAKESIDNTDLEITHMALNDHSVEGLKHRKYRARSVQFDPGGNPGPHDADYIIEEFINTLIDL